MTVDCVDVVPAREFRLGIKVSPYNERMKAARLGKGLTQADLALLVGASANQIGLIERLASAPDGDLAQEIADALEESVETLFPEWVRQAKLNERFSRDIAAEVGPTDVLGDRCVDLITLSESLSKAIKSLSQREARVLELGFGLNGCPPLQLQQIAREFGVETSCVRQVEARALAKLRNGPDGRCLEELLR